MHISDGVLSPYVIGAGWAIAIPALALSIRSLKADQVGAYGVIAAAFFAGSTIHVPVGPFSMHLVLSGIAGLLLGWGALTVVTVGLLLRHNMKIVFSFVFTILILLPSVANAHGLYLSSKEGSLYANFSDHSPAAGAVVTVVDEDGIEIIRDTLNEEGMWVLPKDIEGEPKFVIVEATGGHLTRIAWQEVLHETSKGFFDYLSVRIAIGVVVLGGGGFFIKRLLTPKSQIRNSK
ncbi:MAG: hypothetical protein A2069_03200 [Planctomycetes bacterium GWB2_41_19]|nr:MAG: hypothetical protein A2069_03200 [Planctomycetes bacterium GWB2_41_19]